MADIHVNIDDFDRVVRLFKNAQQQCISFENTIRTYSESLLGSWDGESKKAFEKQYKDIEMGMSKYKDVLGNIADELSSISTVFRDTDTDISKSMSTN